MPEADVDIAIGRAEPSQAAQLSTLAEQLGYPSTPEQIRERLAAIMAAPQNAVFVALAGESVVGYIHVAVNRELVLDPELEIQSLVIHGDHRSKGIGEMLLDAAERYAIEQGCGSLYVRSNVIRERAHRFYQRNGYRIVKTQHALRKILG